MDGMRVPSTQQPTANNSASVIRHKEMCIIRGVLIIFCFEGLGESKRFEGLKPHNDEASSLQQDLSTFLFPMFVNPVDPDPNAGSKTFSSSLVR